jgi:hypothetical protein
LHTPPNLFHVERRAECGEGWRRAGPIWKLRRRRRKKERRKNKSRHPGLNF